jgi:hypothetical protein
MLVISCLFLILGCCLSAVLVFWRIEVVRVGVERREEVEVKADFFEIVQVRASWNSAVDHLWFKDGTGESSRVGAGGPF